MLRYKKWAFMGAAALAAALAGCGGSHSSSSSSSSGSTSGGSGSIQSSPATIQVELPTPTQSLVYISFLTGAARQAVNGDKYVIVENALIEDTPDNVAAVRSSLSPLTMDLDQYQIQYATIDVPMETAGYNVNSEMFDHFTFNPFAFIDPASPVYGNTPPANEVPPNPVIAETPFPCRLTVFPGRDSILPVYLTDPMFTYNQSTGQEDPTLATVGSQTPWLMQVVNEPSTNNPNTNGKMIGFLSDYIQFDIGSTAWKGVKVTLQGGTGKGNTATHFYMSGDNYAISDDTVGPTGDANSSNGGDFEEFTYDPNNPLDGYMGQPNTPPPAGTNTPFPTNNFPGTYNLLELNPQDLTGATQITSIYGRWRNIFSNNPPLAVPGTSTFDLIVLPNSDESYTLAEPADCVALVHSGTKISNLYVGYCYFTGNPQTGSGTYYPGSAYLYNLSDFQVGATASQVVYGLNAYLNSAAGATNYEPAIRSGSFTLMSGTPPTGFPQKGQIGKFIVFR